MINNSALFCHNDICCAAKLYMGFAALHFYTRFFSFLATPFPSLPFLSLFEPNHCFSLPKCNLFRCGVVLNGESKNTLSITREKQNEKAK